MSANEGLQRRSNGGGGKSGQCLSGGASDLRRAGQTVGRERLHSPEGVRAFHDVIVSGRLNAMVPAPSPAVAQLEELRRVHRPLLVLYPDRAVNPSRIALLSGSFDPITVAHAALADAARLRSELVVLIYSARRLPKEGPPQPPLLEESIRLEVVERFCRTRRGFVLGLCSHALLADQVVAARTRFPGAELELAMGSDKLVQLLHPKWYPNRARDAVLDALFVGARILYAVREGEEEVVRETLQRKENQRWAGRIDRLDQVPPEVAAISSRSVRRRLRRGEEIGHLVPPEVHRLLAHPDRYGGT